MPQAYALCKSMENDQWHLFKATYDHQKDEYKVSQWAQSECGKIDAADCYSSTSKGYRSEESARKAIGLLGREVCGVCVSTLYGDL